MAYLVCSQGDPIIEVEDKGIIAMSEISMDLVKGDRALHSDYQGLSIYRRCPVLINWHLVILWSFAMFSKWWRRLLLKHMFFLNVKIW